MHSLFVLLHQQHAQRANTGLVTGSCAFLGPYLYSTVGGSVIDRDPAADVVHQRRCDIFSQRTVFDPVILGLPWTLAVVLPSDGVIMQHNSLGRHFVQVRERLKLWLSVEATRCGQDMRRPPTCAVMDGRSPQ